MKTVGRVESLWRYPVKSMRGEQLAEAFVGFAGVYGDRCYAFQSSAAIKGFPYLTAREKCAMLLHTPAYRDPAVMRHPPNLSDAEALGPGVTPVYPDDAAMMVDVRTPDGEWLPVDDPRLVASLREDVRDAPGLTLLRSHRSMTDCRPVSLFSHQTAAQLGREAGADLDVRCFRANFYLDLDGQPGFAEDSFVGRRLRLGDQVIVAVMDRDPRCKMITLDPDTGEANPEIIKALAKSHDTEAGVYAVVLVEGTVRPGDAVAVLD